MISNHFRSPLVAAHLGRPEKVLEINPADNEFFFAPTGETGAKVNANNLLLKYGQTYTRGYTHPGPTLSRKFFATEADDDGNKAQSTAIVAECNAQTVPTLKSHYVVTKPEKMATKSKIAFKHFKGDPVPWPSDDEIAAAREESQQRIQAAFYSRRTKSAMLKKSLWGQMKANKKKMGKKEKKGKKEKRDKKSKKHKKAKEEKKAKKEKRGMGDGGDENKKEKKARTAGDKGTEDKGMKGRGDAKGDKEDKGKEKKNAPTGSETCSEDKGRVGRADHKGGIEDKGKAEKKAHTEGERGTGKEDKGTGEQDKGECEQDKGKAGAKAHTEGETGTVKDGEGTGEQDKGEGEQDKGKDDSAKGDEANVAVPKRRGKASSLTKSQRDWVASEVFKTLGPLAYNSGTTMSNPLLADMIEKGRQGNVLQASVTFEQVRHVARTHRPSQVPTFTDAQAAFVDNFCEKKWGDAGAVPSSAVMCLIAKMGVEEGVWKEGEYTTIALQEYCRLWRQRNARDVD